jgi:hypothetical protein
MGDVVSNNARNMQVQAKITNEKQNTWTFTVFKVVPAAFVSGKITDAPADGLTPFVLPVTAVNFIGDALAGKYLGLEGGGTGTNHHPELGHNHFKESNIAYGGIVIRGRIYPSNMDKTDFFTQNSRVNGFDWKRRSFAREYDKNGVIFANQNWLFASTDNLDDDTNDGDEDLNPDHDGNNNELFVWVYDIPSTDPAGLTPENNVQRMRKRFKEELRYAGVKVSRTVTWYWRSSQELRDGKFEQKDDLTAQGDNQLVVDEDPPKPLTPDLNESAIPDFAVTDSTPTAAVVDDAPAAVINGNHLDGKPNYPGTPRVYMVCEFSDDVSTQKSIVRLFGGGATPTQITGTYETIPPIPFGGSRGEYTVKIFIGDKAKDSPNHVVVTNP